MLSKQLLADSNMLIPHIAAFRSTGLLLFLFLGGYLKSHLTSVFNCMMQLTKVESAQSS